MFNSLRLSIVVLAEVLLEVLAEVLIEILTEILIEILIGILIEILKVKASLVVYCLGSSVS